MRWSTLCALMMLCVVAFGINSGVVQEKAQAQKKRPERPNVLIVMTDDQDAASVKYMPAVRRYVARQGTTFPNFTYTDPLCCPSRASILTGMYPHNHGVKENKSPGGGYPAFRRNGNEKRIFPIPLRKSGYTTAFFGKYMNEYDPSSGKPRGNGWDAFYISKGRKSANFAINGRHVSTDHETTDRAIAAFAEKFIERKAKKNKPVFMFTSFYASHSPYKPYEKRFRKMYRDVTVPKGPAFNEKDVSDKPGYVRANDQLSDKKIRQLNVDYRHRLRQLRTVDGFVRRAVKGFAKAGELDNTYIIFLSDNGYLMGQHRLMYKRHAYTESSSFPLMVRGPGVEANRSDERVIANIDLAPTILDIANARESRWIDGETFLPILNNPNRGFRESVLLEDFASLPSDSYVDAYRAIRTPDKLYVEYSTGENEFYDLEEDPYQLENIYGEWLEEQTRLSARLKELKDCAGASCRRAEN